jgi:hypothetical protein
MPSDHDYYERTQQRLNEVRRANRQAFDRARSEWLRSLKARPCTDCGEQFPPEAMEWDHLPGNAKLGDISTAMRAKSADVILAEIAKCELVCANCHAIRTRSRLLARRGVNELAEGAVNYRVEGRGAA